MKEELVIREFHDFETLLNRIRFHGQFVQDLQHHFLWKIVRHFFPFEDLRQLKHFRNGKERKRQTAVQLVLLKTGSKFLAHSVIKRAFVQLFLSSFFSISQEVDSMGDDLNHGRLHSLQVPLLLNFSIRIQVFWAIYS